MRLSIFAWLLLACSHAYADVAVDWQGKKHPGELFRDAGTWAFQGRDGKLTAIKQISYIRFSAAPTPLPMVPLTNTLHLPNEQRIGGMLQIVDGKHVGFTTFLGKRVQLERKHVVGIEQARILAYDDFEQSSKDWQLVGQPALDRDHSFHGKTSLLLDRPKQSAMRSWKPTLTEGDVRVYFRDGADSRFSFDVFADSAKPPVLTLLRDADGYACVKHRDKFGVLKRSSGWHQLNLELRAGRLRVYVDDACLGETKADALARIRIANDAGKAWLDELLVTMRLPVLPIPSASKEQDTVWLTHGEQLFGKIVKSDRQAASLDSKLGERAIPWSQLRGIFFAQPQSPNAADEPAITFRAGPGFSLDMVRARLVRWDGTRLIVLHSLLGEIPLERDRLESIRWLAK